MSYTIIDYGMYKLFPFMIQSFYSANVIPFLNSKSKLIVKFMDELKVICKAGLAHTV